MNSRTCLGQLFLSGVFTNYQLLLLARHEADFANWSYWLQFSQRRISADKAAMQHAVLRGVLTNRQKFMIKAGTRLITVLDSEYPERLIQIYDPPAVLHCSGHVALLQQMAVGVVGTRTCSVYGRQATRQIVPHICREDVVIVSGLAQGIDGLAHQLTCMTGGKTIGVLGNGLNHVYPHHHVALQHQLMQEQLVISPFPPETPPRPFQFPQRNRIIAGLSHLLLVVEARLRSGSLITASLAQESNRIVGAVPGRINDPLSAGCNALIADGAVPVNTAADVLSQLPNQFF